MSIGAILDFSLKAVGGLIITGAAMQALAFGWISTFGPHGISQQFNRPTCSAHPCVVVAGLQDDVSLGFGASGEIIGLDGQDDTAQRLVEELNVRTAEGARVEVLRYPVKVGLPGAGAGRDDDTVTDLVTRARTIAADAGADLVVIGRVVNDDSVTLAFVDPDAASNELTRIPHRLDNADAHADLLHRLSAALRGAPVPGGGETLPPPSGEELPPPPEPQEPVKPDPIVFSPPLEPPPLTPHEPVVTRARVNRMPDQDDVDLLYPARALERGTRGQATVECGVTLEGRLQQCSVVRETPTGRGFGEAAVRLAQRNTTAFPEHRDGEPVANSRLRITFTFVPPS